MRVITIDGPSGVGKGTIARLLAKHLNWNLLDSGALYRLTALSALRQGVALDRVDIVSEVARSLQVRFDQEANIFLDHTPVTQEIRTEEIAIAAAQIATAGEVRSALLQLQRSFACNHGLVADGRDMGTVVFANAPLKLFLVADPEERARRRYRQLKKQGLDANLSGLLHRLKIRDQLDMSRTVSPLGPADDAVVLDTTFLSIDEVLQQSIELAAEQKLS